MFITIVYLSCTQWNNASIVNHNLQKNIVEDFDFSLQLEEAVRKYYLYVY